ncbi:MAG: hypothetical protein RML38_04445 [Bacteroidia bacterium]|nr:hypothetical protein [Bacteroidia bacterium]
MDINKVVEMFTGQQPACQEFIEKILKYTPLPIEKLLDEANEGYMERTGDIEFKLPSEDRIVIFLIIICRVLEGEDVTPIHKKFIRILNVSYGYSYIGKQLIKILFCAYHIPIIRESIWEYPSNSGISFWSRLIDLEFKMLDILNSPYLPQGILTDLKQVIENYQQDLHNSNSDDKNICLSKFNKETKKLFDKLLENAERPLPPKLPSIEEFLSQYQYKR